MISRLNKEYLNEIKFNLEQLARSKIILNERLKKNNINNRYQEEKYRLEHYSKKLEEKSKRLEELKKEEENLDIEKIKEDIKKEFIDLFNIKLIIS